MRLDAVAVVTRSGYYVIRVESQPRAYDTAKLVTGQLWETLAIASDQRVTIEADPGISSSAEGRVTGGAGLRLVDCILRSMTRWFVVLGVIAVVALGLRRDEHVDREIARWSRVVAVLHTMTERSPRTAARTGRR